MNEDDACVKEEREALNGGPNTKRAGVGEAPLEGATRNARRHEIAW